MNNKIFTLIILTCSIIFSENCLAQGRVYCELLGTHKFMSKKVTVEVDFGQEQSFWSSDKLKDENGKTITFNSMIDAMNYMGSKGWEFVQAYVVTVSNQNVYHWLLTKYIGEDDDIKEDFKPTANNLESKETAALVEEDRQ